MAFRQPTYHAPQRIYTAPAVSQAQSQSAQQHQSLADEQEWILFSPGTAESSTDRTYTASTARTRTAGRSRISDFGSLDTAARRYGYDERSDLTESPVEDDEAVEDGELDSLDSHIEEFRTEPSVYRQSGEASGTVLPTHDGLGSFRIDRPSGMGEEVQEHLYAFERYNPRRVKRRRESLELGMLELENERAAEAERTRRIEVWRMEQSRVLVEEIQRETRRRKQSMSSEKRSILQDREQEDLATLSNVGSHYDEPDTENESFWNRITRRVIYDLMGIDDDMLSILFGESLPPQTTPPANQPTSTPNGLIPTQQYDTSSWEYRLLERIARELGLLVNQLSDHPGAFSTYLHSQQTPLPYAGLPVIPEASRDQPLPSEGRDSAVAVETTPAEPNFIPTLQTQTIAQPLSIPQASTSLGALPIDTESTPRTSNPLSQPMTREEWEADLDIKMVFRYLRSRFSSKFRSSSSPTTTLPANVINFSTSGTSHLATASTADTAARAARVRQHHPLVTKHNGERRRSIERRTWKVSVPGNGGQAGIGMMTRRGSSSCASERMSVGGLGAGVGKRNSGSSRHYWDFGGPGSVGSGSLIASTGAMGSWGEV
jgi:hypothetical protein